MDMSISVVFINIINIVVQWRNYRVLRVLPIQRIKISYKIRNIVRNEFSGSRTGGMIFLIDFGTHVLGIFLDMNKNKYIYIYSNTTSTRKRHKWTHSRSVCRVRRDGGRGGRVRGG